MTKPILAVLVQLFLLWGPFTCRFVSGQDISQAIDAFELQLDALTSRMVSLTEKLDGLMKDEDEAGYGLRRLDKRLDKLLGMTGSCNVGFFPCGPGPVGSGQCIRDYLVCDGSTDCKNGADEDKERCVNPFKDGPNLSIASIKDTCLGTVTGHPHWWTFYPSETLPWFPSRPKLPWIYLFPDLYLDGMQSVAFYADCVYDFATGDVIITWASAHKLVGRAWVEPISATKSRYMVEVDRPHQPKGQTCYTGVAVMQK